VKIFRGTAGYTTFDHKRNEENLEEFENRTSQRETKKLQITLATTCNKSEQQQDAKKIRIHAEFETKWTKTAWRTFEET